MSEEVEQHAWKVLSEAEQRKEMMRQQKWTQNDRSPSLIPISDDEESLHPRSSGIEHPKSSNITESRGNMPRDHGDSYSMLTNSHDDERNDVNEINSGQRIDVTELEEINEQRVVYCEKSRKPRTCQACRQHKTR